jgi:hypothetical protein
MEARPPVRLVSVAGGAPGSSQDGQLHEAAKEELRAPHRKATSSAWALAHEGSHRSSGAASNPTRVVVILGSVAGDGRSGGGVPWSRFFFLNVAMVDLRC